jgi:dTDP-4-dehydrorhamnose reductase
LPTVELARVMHDFVLPNPTLRGVYHVSVDAIDKYSLLRLVADAYGKEIAIAPDDKVAIDRSLDSSRFRAATGYAPPQWDALVAAMRKFG